MLYRSPFTRFVLVGAGLFAGVMLTFGSGRWRSTPSLLWLADSTPMPLRGWGALVIVYALLLILTTSRPVAYTLGTILCAVFTISIWATVADGGPANSFVLAAMIDATAFHAFSIRTSWAQKLLVP